MATLRRPEILSDFVSKFSKDQLLILKVDVTSATQIDHAFRTLRDTFGRLDVVFNNAGTNTIGEIEATPEETARSLFDVNFWGATNISRAAVSFFREVNYPGEGGTLLQVSSMLAQEASAGAGYYSARYAAMFKSIHPLTASVTLYSKYGMLYRTFILSI